MPLLPNLARFSFFGRNTTQLPMTNPDVLQFGDQLLELVLSPAAAGIPRETWDHLITHSVNLRVLHVNTLSTRAIGRAILASDGAMKRLRFLSLSPLREQKLEMTGMQRAGLLQDEDMYDILEVLSPSLEVLLLAGQQALQSATLSRLNICSSLKVLGLRGCLGLCEQHAAQALHECLQKCLCPPLQTVEVPCMSTWSKFADDWPELRVITPFDPGLQVQSGAPLWNASIEKLNMGAFELEQTTRVSVEMHGPRGWAGGTPYRLDPRSLRESNSMTK
eukprot:TRINITY_DN15295_c0_g1_i1.p1 TRINITY_DN15295_c0_g1~~TRINITY_DN15295_c0_g1_i1.p1  ORF type:complete len:277 (-),score=10.12 TRINITY_DN15295_c0_g1_i1:91-921(-)